MREQRLLNEEKAAISYFGEKAKWMNSRKAVWDPGTLPFISARAATRTSWPTCEDQGRTWHVAVAVTVFPCARLAVSFRSA
jgi:hypothetical protein